jgi:large subunit ribosomal protein L18e
MTTNESLQQLITKLNGQDSKLLRRVAADLSRPTRIRREVNLARIDSHTDENEVIIVPGKVLGGGELNHKVTISAFKFSESALEKLQKAGSKVIPMDQLTTESVKGKKVRIIG